MLTFERHKTILELLNNKKNITIQELIKVLNVSEATIRRDLTLLEKKQKLKRVHGGAILINNQKQSITEDWDISSRNKLFKDEKEMIAKKASTFIENNSTIYLDAGTTTFLLIKYLKNKNVKVVTNGLNFISELEKYNIETYLLGGKIKSKTSCTVGYFAQENLKNFQFDYVFLGANTFNLKGFTTPDPEEALLKKESINLGTNIFFLCDHSKIDQKGFIVFASLSEGTLITDKTPSEEYFEETNVEVAKK